MYKSVTSTCRTWPWLSSNNDSTSNPRLRLWIADGPWFATLTNLPKLNELHLSHNCINDAEASALGIGLGKNSKLKKITMEEDIDITPAGWAAFFRGLSNSNFTLEDININSNQIGDEGALAFAAAARTNTSLKSLDMSNCPNSGVHMGSII